MRVLFVYSLRDGLTLQHPLASLGDIHIGLSYVSACLKARGHSTRLMVLSSERQARSLARLDAVVSEFDPQLVAFTAVSTQFPFISAAAGQGIDAMLARVSELLSRRWLPREIDLPLERARAPELYQCAQVLSETVEGKRIRYRLRVTAENFKRLRQKLGNSAS